jgi:hypothetical protein
MDTAIKRAAPLTGVTFALLYLAAMFLYRKGQPEFAADPGEITEYFAAQSAYVSLGSLAVFVSAPFWFVFIGCVYSSIKSKEDGVGRLAATQLASGATAAAVSIVGALCAAIGAIRAERGTLDAGAATVYFDAATALLYTGTAVAATGFLFALAAASLRYGAVFPKPVGWIALILAVLFLIPPISWISLPLGVLLMVFASIRLYLERAGEL